MSELIYLSTVLYFFYVINLALGDQILNYLKNKQHPYAERLTKLLELTNSFGTNLGNLINFCKPKRYAKTD